MKTQVIDEKEWPENRTAKIGLLVNKKTNKTFGKKKKYQELYRVLVWEVLLHICCFYWLMNK